jgi:hypothetical protein
MLRCVFVLVFFCLTSVLYSSDCKSITKEEEYEKSNLVVLGYTLEKNEEYVIIKVIEVFKGDIIVDSKVKAFLGDGLINPEIGETWLLYGSFLDDRINISICGYSRSFNKPYSKARGSIPPPPRLDEASRNESNLIENIYLNRALSELQFDILDLRQRKLERELGDIKKRESGNKDYLLWFAVALLVLILTLNVSSFFKGKRYK